MQYTLEYGKSKIKFTLKDKSLLYDLHPNHANIQLTGEAEVRRAIENPISSKGIEDIVKPGEKIAIITSDITRPMPSSVVLPIIIEKMLSVGVKKDDIIIVFALGSHRAHTEEEKKYLVGENIYNEFRCIDSDVNDYLHLGYSKRGTPIDIFTPVAKADRRICLGNIEFHYFAGYSGGAKAIMPGVSTNTAIKVNHSMMVEEEAKAGNIVSNPLREDIDEVESFVPIDFIVNVVLDENKEIIKAVAGHYIKAHRAGCNFLDGLNKIQIKQKADIVITSPGGYPKDINLYQAQKALDNAKYAVKDNGIIIFVAACNEGVGSHMFEKWMKEALHSEDLIIRVKKHFELGGHKAAAIAMILEKAKIFMVSEMGDATVKEMFITPFPDIQSALDQAIREKGNDAKVIIMSHGASVLPVLI
jgi:nickel-dependent lactate racemase